MKKRRGKQPAKPDMGEAMKERSISLKGKQNSTMNIPMIFRRTFGWNEENVMFRPVNKRSFIVSRPDIPDEEFRAENHLQRDLDLSDLPWYHKERARSETDDPSDMEELKEMLLSMSLKDRYVDININRPADSELNSKLRSDLERLSRDLGFKLHFKDPLYTCSFLYPKHSMVQMEAMCSDLLLRSIDAASSFADSVYELDIEGAGSALSDLLYSIQTVESSIDAVFTDSLNLLWDPPPLEPPGHFLLIQAHEAVNDEMENMAKDSIRFLALLPRNDRDICDLIWDEFLQVWRTSVLPSLGLYRQLVAGENGPEERALERIRMHRIWKERGLSPHTDYISKMAQRVESAAASRSGKARILATSDCIKAMQCLFSINDSASRIESISQVAGTMMLYLSRSA